MSGRLNIMKGDKFHAFTIIEELEPYVYKKSKQRLFKCRCECGNIKNVLLTTLRARTYTSCGCRSKIRLHNTKTKIFGVGINDSDEFIYCNNKILHSYTIWHSMMQRCYSKKKHQSQPTYIGCSVCDEWKYFSNFKRWFDENYIEGYQLDKDILVKDNKMYSPNTCCLVPREINNLILKHNARRGLCPIGVSYDKSNKKYAASLNQYGIQVRVGRFNSAEEAFAHYKTAKENYIKEVATNYYNANKISKNVYLSLMRYSVNIND